MNRKAETGQEVLQNEILYLIFLAVFALGMGLFLWQQNNGSGISEDYYAKEIVKIVNLGDVGNEYSLDVSKATKIAQKNRVSFEKIFNFDNEKKEVCVSLSNGRKTCYGYFRNFKVEVIELKQADGSNLESNLLKFKILENENA